MQNSRQICCSTCSVILNVTVTQYMCSLNGIYCPHWLVQWSHHCSHMCILVHSPWRPGYMDVMHTILVILTMAGLFPDKPLYIYIYIYTYIYMYIYIYTLLYKNLLYHLYVCIYIDRYKKYIDIHMCVYIYMLLLFTHLLHNMPTTS